MVTRGRHDSTLKNLQNMFTDAAFTSGIADRNLVCPQAMIMPGVRARGYSAVAASQARACTAHALPPQFLQPLPNIVVTGDHADAQRRNSDVLRDAWFADVQEDLSATTFPLETFENGDDFRDKTGLFPAPDGIPRLINVANIATNELGGVILACLFMFDLQIEDYKRALDGTLMEEGGPADILKSWLLDVSAVETELLKTGLDDSFTEIKAGLTHYEINELTAELSTLGIGHLVPAATVGGPGGSTYGGATQMVHTIGMPASEHSPGTVFNNLISFFCRMADHNSHEMDRLVAAELDEREGERAEPPTDPAAKAAWDMRNYQRNAESPAERKARMAQERCDAADSIRARGGAMMLTRDRRHEVPLGRITHMSILGIKSALLRFAMCTNASLSVKAARLASSLVEIDTAAQMPTELLGDMSVAFRNCMIAAWGHLGLPTRLTDGDGGDEVPLNTLNAAILPSILGGIALEFKTSLNMLDSGNPGTIALMALTQVDSIYSGIGFLCPAAYIGAFTRGNHRLGLQQISDRLHALVLAKPGMPGYSGPIHVQYVGGVLNHFVRGKAFIGQGPDTPANQYESTSLRLAEQLRIDPPPDMASNGALTFEKLYVSERMVNAITTDLGRYIRLGMVINEGHAYTDTSIIDIVLSGGTEGARGVTTALCMAFENLHEEARAGEMFDAASSVIRPSRAIGLLLREIGKSAVPARWAPHMLGTAATKPIATAQLSDIIASLWGSTVLLDAQSDMLNNKAMFSIAKKSPKVLEDSKTVYYAVGKSFAKAVASAADVVAEHRLTSMLTALHLA